MPAQKREIIGEADVEGLKYFQALMPLLEPLHNVGCQRDTAGNRRLHMDQYCALLLLYLFNPCVRSLRALQQASELKNVQRKLGCARVSLGSFSEATDVFEPQRLEAIISQLTARIEPVRKVGGEAFLHQLTAVDGTLVKTLSTIAEAAYLKNRHGQSRSAWRLHTHFDIDRNVPTHIHVTGGLNSGKTDEKHVLRKELAPDHCYVMDRWYAEFGLLNDMHRIGSSYVSRIRDNSQYQVLEDRPLSPTAVTAGLLGDSLVNLGAGRGTEPDHPVRLIQVRTTPHTKRGRSKGGTAGPPSDGILRIITDLPDVPAEVIADIFRHRWLIELFFRFFKHVLGCRHLLSTDPVGIEIQAYMAIIACLLISLWTGRKPTLRTYEMICLYFQGWADEGELIAHIQKLNPHAP